MKNSEIIPDPALATGAIRAILDEVEGVEWDGEEAPLPVDESIRVDLIVNLRVEGTVRQLLVEVKSSGAPRVIQQVSSVLGLASGGLDGHPLLVAPFVSSRGRALCKQLGLGFVDLAGNAYINLPGLLVERWGRENLRKERRELKHLFSRKATWVARRLFEEPGREWTTTELSKESGVSIGHVQKTVSKLADEGYVEKKWGAIRLVDTGGLLDSWREIYRFDSHGITGYHCPLRGLREILEGLRTLPPDGWALTLGAAAGMVAPFVRTTDVHVYVVGPPDVLIEALDLTLVEFGGNVHLMTPGDEGVLMDRRIVEGVWVVSDLQLYLDLYNWPTRGREQADHLRETIMEV